MAREKGRSGFRVFKIRLMGWIKFIYNVGVHCKVPLYFFYNTPNRFNKKLQLKLEQQKVKYNLTFQIKFILSNQFFNSIILCGLFDTEISFLINDM